MYTVKTNFEHEYTFKTYERAIYKAKFMLTHSAFVHKIFVIDESTGEVVHILTTKICPNGKYFLCDNHLFGVILV